ncbi:TolC family protein [Winogradskyella endarachnes]|nr:TolC family protein [Winogradskyella endarachnes]
MNKLNLTICAILLITTVHKVIAQSDNILENYIKIAIESNVALKRETLNFEQSLEALKEAKRSFYPTVSLNANFQTAAGQNLFGLQIQDQLDGFLRNLDMINNSLEQLDAPNYPDLPSYLTGNDQGLNDALNQNQQTFVRLAIPVYNAAIIENHKIKKELVTLSKLSQEYYKDELVKEVKTTYYHWLQAGEIVKVFENALALASENVRTNRSLLNNSKITKDGLLSAEAREAEVNQELITARKNQRLAQAFFNFLLNRAYDMSINQTEIDDDIINLQSLSFYEQLALSQRRDLQQIIQLQSVREAQIGLEKATMKPRVNLAVDAGYRGNEYAFTTEDDFVAVGAQLTWNVFTFGKSKAKIQQAQLDQEIAKTLEEELIEKIKIEVVEAYLEVEAAYEQLAAAQKEVNASQEELKLVMRKFELGSANRLEIESAETDFQNAQLREVAAKYNVLSQKASLERASSSYNYEE